MRGDVDSLVAELDTAIKDADTFIKEMDTEEAGATSS
jgi:hypothetical protein